MGMQLLYGNDGKNYHTFAKSKDLTDVQEKELLNRYLGYDFADAAAPYTSSAAEPAALTYATTDLNGTLPEEMILLARQARMSGYRTPSYYAHFHLLEISSEWYGENFLDLLQFAFIKDSDAAAYQSRDIDSFAQEKQGGSIPVRRDGMKKEMLVPAVAAVLAAADQMSARVCLVLDAEGDSYNQRALEVIAAVYACIPYNIRKKAGFCTYAGMEPSHPAGRAKVQLYPREALPKMRGEAGMIDLAHAGDSVQGLQIPGEIFRFAEGLVKKQESKRAEQFASFQQAFGLHAASVQEHLLYQRHIEKWQSGSLEEMKDDLARYAYKGMQQDAKPLLFQVFCTVFSRRFAEEQFDRRYGQMLREMLWMQKGFAFDNKLKAYLMLGEALDCLQFDTEMFLSWERENVLEKAGRRYEGEELKQYLAGQRKKLHMLPVRGRKFREAGAAMEKQMKEYLAGHSARQRR